MPEDAVSAALAQLNNYDWDTLPTFDAVWDDEDAPKLEPYAHLSGDAAVALQPILKALPALLADLALARAVLESASVSGPTEPHWRRLWVKEDVWQAWRERQT